ncbi:putative periplasmic lipoprotein [Lacunimicrobium album]
MRAFVATMFLATLLNGCGNSSFTRVPVAGEVIQDGSPVLLADIMFVSRPGQEVKERPQAGARVQDGKFSISREDGPMPGPQLAKIAFLKEQANPVDPGSAEPSRGPSYNVVGYATAEIKIPEKGTDSLTITIDSKQVSKGGEGI